MPTTSEKRSLRVYCLIALRAKMSSRNSGVNVFSNKAHTIIITGSRSFHNLNSSSSMEGILHPPEKEVLLPHTCVVPSTLKWLDSSPIGISCCWNHVGWVYHAAQTLWGDNLMAETYWKTSS